MLMTVVSGLVVGMAAGFVLQRGRFCMNSAFRDTIFIQDYTFLKAAMIALLVAMVGANFLEDIGQIQALRRQVFAPIGNILGGYLFGMGIVIAGGCGSGIWFRVGEGLVSAFFSVLGFMIAILASQVGVLSPLVNALRSYRVGLDDGGKFVTGGEITNQLTLYNVFGMHDIAGIPLKWIVIAILAAAALPFIFNEKFARPKKGFPPHVTGLLMGLVIVAAWWASEVWGGGARGVSYTGPTAELFRSILNANLIPDALYSNTEVADFLSEQGVALPEKQWPPTWSAFLVLGTPIGAYISARALKEFKWVVPDAQTMVKVFLGGLLMGFGAVLGGGCNVGHSLTGFSTLAMSSIVSTVFIILGNWTMVYFLFIKPMQDLE